MEPTAGTSRSCRFCPVAICAAACTSLLLLQLPLWLHLVRECPRRVPLPRLPRRLRHTRQYHQQMQLPLLLLLLLLVLQVLGARSTAVQLQVMLQA